MRAPVGALRVLRSDETSNRPLKICEIHSSGFLSDMIAIPDFISGAMENWGLITYRETKLLISPNEESFEAMRKIIHVIAHELAHQWFGNLGVCKLMRKRPCGQQCQIIISCTLEFLLCGHFLNSMF